MQLDYLNLSWFGLLPIEQLLLAVEILAILKNFLQRWFRNKQT